ncbi:pantoate--beta-alanine ligase [Larkinella arboricola]|uniref:Pantothenate synthetase n=1 Tax=Larkinella arboricola TaxID=643671 RepID=A0A327X9I9_LARAB|nr:pantoate--beta-alanine ligase [Larkinella arboricola]RAK02523.1 pantoate--beta-alanine ligase [Larkinella arboricola]
MHLYKTIADLRQAISSQRKNGLSIGLVPTMGALHAGHLSLIDASKTQNDLTVCSIFVNPTQFNNPDDLARYPHTLEADCALLEAAGCDLVFAPSVDEIYPTSPVLTFHFGELETVMEGAFRPGHFNGVGLVVSKLFNIVQPDRAYFGQKDLQQVAVVKRLVRDLGFPLELIRMPIVREEDGLAMSSRNRNLTPDERQQALELYRALSKAQEVLQTGGTIEAAKIAINEHFRAHPAFRLEYFEIANADTLQPVDQLQAPGTTALCIAAHLGKTRLIDNLIL